MPSRFASRAWNIQSRSAPAGTPGSSAPASASLPSGEAMERRNGCFEVMDDEAREADGNLRRADDLLRSASSQKPCTARVQSLLPPLVRQKRPALMIAPAPANLEVTRREPFLAKPKAFH